MKKVISIMTILVMVVAILTTNTYAAAPTYSIELNADTKEAYQGGDVTLTLRVKDFENMTNGIMGLTAQIEYDQAFFETLTQESIVGKGTWSTVPTFNPQTNQITADSGVGIKTDSDVFTIKLKVKANALVGTSTTVKVKNFEAAESDTELKPKTDAVIDIKVKAKEDPTPEDPNNNNITTPDTNNIIDVNNNTNANTTNNVTNNKTNTIGNNTSNNTTQSTTKLPQTGENDWIFITLIGATLIGMFSYIKYRSMK